MKWRVRAILSILTTLYVASRLVLSGTIRSAIAHVFNPRRHPIGFLILAATLLLNIKSLPLVWHVRVLSSLVYQLYHKRPTLPKDALFRPMILTGCRSGLAEIDYNLHKSNSTYFADFDVARSALISCLLRKGVLEHSQKRRRARRAGSLKHNDATTVPTSIVAHVARTESALGDQSGYEISSPNDSETASGPTSTPCAGPKLADAPTSDTDTRSASGKPRHHIIVVLGGVCTTFHHEIKPYEKYDIWTRVLSWDRKWIYLVSHMVKAGAGAPDEFALQPWKKGQRRVARGKYALGQTDREAGEEWKSAVFASSISKYVIKRGRLTIAPEIVFQRGEMIPANEDTDLESVRDCLDDSGCGASYRSQNEGPYTWTAANVERERQRGWDVLARHFAQLDKAGAEWPVAWDCLKIDGESHEEIKGAEMTRKSIGVLGTYPDWLGF